MNAILRREKILAQINEKNNPVSASFLAQELSVSRQVIVGDIALLRAAGHEIIATARGYIIPKHNENRQYIGKIVCQHTPENTKDELYQIVDLQAVVLNVIVEHNLYGEIAGALNLTNRQEVDEFLERVESSEIKLLSELTMGVHTHTIACRNKTHFNQVIEKLNSCGYLYNN
jgi:transcriptional regulator of NAD metabolism